MRRITVLFHTNILRLNPIWPALLVLLALSCAQTSRMRVESESEEIGVRTETAVITELEPETFEEIGAIADIPEPALWAEAEERGRIPEGPPESPGETTALVKVEPVFLEPPIRWDRLSLREAPTTAVQETPATVQVNRIERPETVIPERPVVPPAPEYILGRGLMTEESLAGFLLSYNPEAKDFSEELAKLYVEEAGIEGVNHDIAFAQMCLETGFLTFGNLVTADQYNFAGLGATGPEQQGERFPDPRTGVRAHIQHLKAYATDEFPKQELVDPRYFYVHYGSSPKISGLTGTWAEDRLYGEKIRNMLERLYEFTFLK